MTSLAEKLPSSVTESASENENQNSPSSDNETLPDSPIKQKCKRQCIQLLCAEECSEEETLKEITGRNNEPDDAEKEICKRTRTTRYSE